MTTEDTKARHAPGNLESTESTDGPSAHVGEHDAEVNAALDWLESDRAFPDYEPPGMDTVDAVALVIDEVRRLRAKLARVEALPAQLRKLAPSINDPITEHLCAQAIEAALNASVEAEADEGA
jgi:hypothetical protein